MIGNEAKVLSAPVLGIEYSIHNTSTAPLHIKFKGGVHYSVGGSGTVRKGEISRYVIVTLSPLHLDCVIINKDEAYSKFDKKLLELLSKRIGSLTVGGDAPTFISREISELSVKVYLEADIAECDKVIHSELLGISLYIGEPGDVPGMYTPRYELNGMLIKETKGIRMAAYVNDPEDRFRNLYTNVFGESVIIPSIRDYNQPSGLYLMKGSGNNLNEYSKFELDDLDDKTLETIGIFSSRDECDKYGGNTNVKTQLERKVTELENNLSNQHAKSSDTIKGLRDNLIKETERVKELTTELKDLKLSHAFEIRMLKLQQESLKTTNTFMKQEGKVKEALSKSEIEALKQKRDGGMVETLLGVVERMGGFLFRILTFGL